MEQLFHGNLLALVEQLQGKSAIITTRLPHGTVQLHEPCTGRIQVQNGNIVQCIITADSGRAIHGHEALKRMRAITQWSVQLVPTSPTSTAPIPIQYSPALPQSPVLPQYSPALPQQSPALSQQSPALITSAQQAEREAMYSTRPLNVPALSNKSHLQSGTPQQSRGGDVPPQHPPAGNPLTPPPASRQPTAENALTQSQLLPPINSHQNVPTMTSNIFPVLSAYVPKPRQNIPPAVIEHMNNRERMIVRMVYMMINGQRSIAEIKEQLHLSPEIVDRVLYELLRMQLIE